MTETREAPAARSEQAFGADPAPKPSSERIQELEAACATAGENADEAESARRLTPATVDALRRTRLLQAYVPAVYGGPELDPRTVSEALQRVAAADGAAGWCAMIAATTTSIACLLPEPGARTVFGDPAAITGGAYAPSGRATVVDGGFRLTGRWSWGSGTDHCDWVSAGATTDAGEQRLLFVPKDAVTFHDTWWSMGLRGTASGDFSVDDVFVPIERTMRPGMEPRYVEAPVAHFPMFNLLASGVASVCLGIAQRAVDEIVALARGKTPTFASKTLAHQPAAQIDIAKAATVVAAARSLLRDELAAAWAAVQRGERPSTERKARIRAACTHAAEESARATDLAYHLGGGSSVYASNPLQRCFRDVHTATQHLMIGRRVMETVGRVILGLEADTATL